MSISRAMDKDDVVHIYTMEYYLAIKKSDMMPATWMDLEIIIRSQKDKDKYHVISMDYITLHYNVITLHCNVMDYITNGI